MQWAMPVLDEELGESLEYCQLRRHPWYRDVWDTSYANELGRLCQRIGTSMDGKSKQVEGMDTFFVIDYDEIPLDHCKEVTYTKVVCEVQPQKEDPNRMGITIGATAFVIPVMLAPP